LVCKIGNLDFNKRPAFFSGAAADYILSLDVNSSTITDRTDHRDGADTLVNIERLKFSDTNIALDIYEGQNADMAWRIYKAGLNREPDLKGIGD
jgi:hypothetical protein